MGARESEGPRDRRNPAVLAGLMIAQLVNQHVPWSLMQESGCDKLNNQIRNSRAFMDNLNQILEYD